MWCYHDPVEFIGLGGTNEVGASSYLYRLQEGNLLIDAGLRPGLIGKAALPALELLEEVSKLHIA